MNFPDWSLLSLLLNGNKQRQNEALELEIRIRIRIRIRNYLLIFEKSYKTKKVELKTRSWFPIPVKNSIKIGREKLPQEINANG